MVDNPKGRLKKKTDLDEYEILAKKSIGLFFNEEHIIGYNNLIYAPRYILHLQNHILDPEKMLSVVTWCDLDVLTKDDISEFVRGESATEFIDEDKYNNNYIKRIANNTGLPRKDRLAAFKTFTVCFKEIKNAILYPHKTYHRQFTADKEKINDLEPLSWCATRVCYDSLIKSGFEDITVEKNINLILSTKKLTETRGGRYAFHFYEYIQQVDKKDDNYPIVSPYDSKIFIRYGYLRNWCSVQVCYDDLKAAGFIYWHASDNYFYVYPKYEKKKYSSFLSKYVIAYCDHLKHVSKNYNQRYMGNTSVHPSLKLPENAEPRSPEDFCIFHIININRSYYSYIRG